VSVIVRDAEGASIVLRLDLDGVAASVGSACTTGSLEPSHVLRAMAYPDEEARGSLRLSLGRATTESDMAAALEIVPRVVAGAREGARRIVAESAGDGAPEADDSTRLGTGVVG
jgi:cysteine desulfurase